MTDIETRSFRVPFELRTDGENQTIVGYASTFDQPYPVDMVTEIIDRSAFTRTLSEKPDVYALIGHDPSRILGRTKNGTLSLSIDERGLKCVITPVMTRDAEDTLKLIASGCIDAMSFGFKVVKQAFGYADGKTTRRITDLELHEVSCVAFPANENATLSLRAKQMARECRASKLETRVRGTDVIGYTYDADVHSVKNTKKDFADEIKQSKGRKDMNGIPDDLEDFDGDPVHPIFESDELSELDRAILNQRSTSARLETREDEPFKWRLKSGKKYKIGGQLVEVTKQSHGEWGQSYSAKWSSPKDVRDVRYGTLVLKKDGSVVLTGTDGTVVSQGANGFEGTSPIRSSSARLETREAFNPIYYEYGVFQVKKQSENQTDENGEPLEIGWYFRFRKGRTKDSDTDISEVFSSKSEATNALNKEIEGETNKWENKWGDAESSFEASNPYRSSSAMKLLQLRNRIAPPICEERLSKKDNERLKTMEKSEIFKPLERALGEMVRYVQDEEMYGHGSDMYHEVVGSMDAFGAELNSEWVARDYAEYMSGSALELYEKILAMPDITPTLTRLAKGIKILHEKLPTHLK